MTHTVNKYLIRALVLALSLLCLPLQAREYTIDVEGAHAFVQFRVKHLGISWLYGRFNTFEGKFNYDASDDTKNKVTVSVDVASLDSNHAERDKHLRAKEYLNTEKYPKAKFVSTKFETTGDNTAVMTGNLTLLGVTKEVRLDVVKTGEGKSPWGDERVGFEAKTTINAQDFGMETSWVKDVELIWSVEGIH